ncbi:MAG: succinylglutamate desuccinylase/aspartoacylase family protein, partial [Kiloniellales bacterium]|nr:succinylglutamate desuccinylase/aspartoacylase family protein [Kiloniellales bacterium]
MTGSAIISEIDFDSDGKHLGFLRLPHSVHRSAYGWLPIPVCSIKNGEGPKVLLMAGNHGDEYEGQIMLSRLIAELETGDLSGQMIILPMANYPAANAGLRVSPIDGGNLNRSFPGDPLGSPTQQIAYFIEECLLTRVDYLFDLHSGGSSLLYLPSMLMAWEEDDPRNNERRALLNSFALENAMLFPPQGEGYYSSAAAARKGVIALTTELGGGGTVAPDVLRLADEGLRRVLAAIGVWKN